MDANPIVELITAVFTPTVLLGALVFTLAFLTGSVARIAERFTGARSS